jgi:hypothetical protein
MISTQYETPSIQPDFSEERWVFYTDIYQRYQFRYPASWTITQHEGDVYLKHERIGNSAPSVSPCIDGRFVVDKPQPFHDLIDLEEYLNFKDRLRGVPYATTRTPLLDLYPGYRGIREIVDQVNGLVFSILYISNQARMLPIYASLREGLDIDIKLARSVRFL